MRWAALLILLGWYAAMDVNAIAVWGGELPLWSHALTIAPTSERAQSNYAKARAAVDVTWLPR